VLKLTCLKSCRKFQITNPEMDRSRYITAHGHPDVPNGTRDRAMRYASASFIAHVPYPIHRNRVAILVTRYPDSSRQTYAHRSSARAGVRKNRISKGNPALLKCSIFSAACDVVPWCGA